MRCVSPTLPDGRYLHWNDLRWRPPLDGLNAKDRWLALKMGRLGNRVVIPGFVDMAGHPFWFCRMEAIDSATHDLDRGGRVQVFDVVATRRQTGTIANDDDPCRGIRGHPADRLGSKRMSEGL